VLFQYPTSYEEDMKILEREDLTFNERNSVLMRSGEKKILLFLIGVADKFLPLLDMKIKVFHWRFTFLLGCEDSGSEDNGV